MAKLHLEVRYADITLNTSDTQKAILTIEKGLSVHPNLLISKDSPNDLKVGSDNRLVSQPNDIDFLAYYILAKG